MCKELTQARHYLAEVVIKADSVGIWHSELVTGVVTRSVW